MRQQSNLKIKEVYFPSITVCNINQVEASFLKKIGIHGNLSQTNAIFDQYITGKEGGITKEQEDILETIPWLKEVDLLQEPITSFTWQDCSNMFLHISYQENEIFWRDFEGEYGPWFYGTDYGSCCFFNGVVNMKIWPEGTSYIDVSIKLAKNSLN